MCIPIPLASNVLALLLGAKTHDNHAMPATARSAAPITVGTGVNTKNMAALMHGLPVVTTPIGAQGFKVRARAHRRVTRERVGVREGPASIELSALYLGT